MRTDESHDCMTSTCELSITSIIARKAEIRVSLTEHVDLSFALISVAIPPRFIQLAIAGLSKFVPQTFHGKFPHHTWGVQRRSRPPPPPFVRDGYFQLTESHVETMRNCEAIRRNKDSSTQPPRCFCFSALRRTVGGSVSSQGPALRATCG